jgi:hypothetical protein
MRDSLKSKEVIRISMDMRKTLFKLGMLLATIAIVSACSSQTEIDNVINGFDNAARDITVYQSPT